MLDRSAVGWIKIIYLFERPSKGGHPCKERSMLQGASLRSFPLHNSLIFLLRCSPSRSPVLRNLPPLAVWRSPWKENTECPPHGIRSWSCEEPRNFHSFTDRECVLLFFVFPPFSFVSIVHCFELQAANRSSPARTRAGEVISSPRSCVRGAEKGCHCVLKYMRRR